MENNEITMFMDVKLDIHNKRPDSLKFKQWIRCEVKIEAIKCLPCYLRVSIKTSEDATSPNSAVEQEHQTRQLSVSVIVPGVNISYAASRTKQHSYGLFWTQNRKKCCIYFALETETSCRHHMKWIKKSIKNLELYRQLMLEKTRSSRGYSAMGVSEEVEHENSPENYQQTVDADYIKSTYSTLGPLPQIPADGKLSSWSQRVSHTSQIYEEIFENSDGPRLSRRISRASIASGIYEEMKPTASNFNSIDEEVPDLQLMVPQPPPLPPLPPPRKRINTFNGSDMLGEIPRSNTNPESELAKKKKYKNMLDNIFNGGRAKRAESVSETQACTADELINAITPPKYIKKDTTTMPVYANEVVAKRQNRKATNKSTLGMTKRNSFSSPDLSKINYLDAFNESAMALIGETSLTSSDDFNLSNGSLNDTTIAVPELIDEPLPVLQPKLISTESLNISQQISNNFNFSACNTSTINLMGANGATTSRSVRKNKILIDDLTGYCVMAPIIKKTTTNDVAKTGEPISSGYSTGSYPSTSTSSAEEQLNQATVAPTVKPNNDTNDESTIYEKMHASLGSTAETTDQDSSEELKVKLVQNIGANKDASTSGSDADFTGNLYENLLAVKASQELEYQLPPGTISTSTPTDSPHTQENADAAAALSLEDEENYYQTPRKSIISVDEKIPSYYPNSCDTAKTRRHFNASPHKGTSVSPITAEVATTANEKSVASSAVGLRHLVSLKLRRERKENLYISSPQNIIEQRQLGAKSTDTKSNNTQKANKTHKSIRAGAMKIAEHVYTVKHTKITKPQTSTNNNNNNNNDTDSAGFTDDMRERLQTELLQLAMLQKIDFKFDDAKSCIQAADSTTCSPPTPSAPKQELPPTDVAEQKERIYENLLHKYKDSWMKKCSNSNSNSPSPMLTPTTQAAQSPVDSPNSVDLANSKLEMHHSCIGGTSAVETNNSNCSPAAVTSGMNGVKKFASLPRFKKIDFSPLRLKINSVLQRGQQQDF